MKEAKREAIVGALLRERRGLFAHGKADRVAQVDAELERLGYTVKKEKHTKAEAETPNVEKRPRKKMGTRRAR